MTHSELPVLNQAIQWECLKKFLPAISRRSAAADAPAGLLMEILPEFRAIDSLVVRDFYHRYTVDEHSLRTIEHCRSWRSLRMSAAFRFAIVEDTGPARLADFLLAAARHGKRSADGQSRARQLESLDTAARRLGLSAEEEAEVHFLIDQHLVMSATVQRRDIFDPSIVSGFAESVGTLERLQRLRC